MKKAIIILIALSILLFPISLKAKDGGTVTYFPITMIYRVTFYNRIGENGTLKGTEISVFGIKVYSNTYIEAEQN